VAVDEFAAEQLSPSERDQAERVHAEHYASLLPVVGRGMSMSDLTTLGAEYEHYVAILRRSVARGDFDTACRVLLGAEEVLEGRADLRMLDTFFRETLALEAGDLETRTRLRMAHCSVLYRMDLKQADAADQLLDDAARVADPLLLAEVLCVTAGGLIGSRPDLAEQRLRKAIELVPSGVAVAWIWNNLGHALSWQHRVEEAGACYLRAHQLLMGSDRPVEVAVVLNGLGNYHLRTGAFQKAEEAYREARSLFMELGDHLREGVIHGNIGLCHLASGRMEAAEEWLENAVAQHRFTGQQRSLATALLNLGRVRLMQGRHTAAAAALDRSAALCVEANRPGFEVNVRLMRAMVAADLGEPQALDLRRLASEVSEQRGVPEAPVLVHLYEAYAVRDGRERNAHLDKAVACDNAELLGQIESLRPDNTRS
jgi:tetratricopeptide (TPR) repeat protein